MIDVPADMDSVIKRWYPRGADVIATGRRASPAGVFVCGDAGAGVTSVEYQLDALAGAGLEKAPDAESAAVVVFVMDAAAPIGRRTLAELAPVLESTTVAVLVNKVDVHRDWRDIRRGAAEAIARGVPRAVDVSFWPTSAKLAERAHVAVDDRMRRALFGDSGLTEVHTFLTDALARPGRTVRERRYNAAVHAAARSARAEIVEKAREVTSASSTVELRSERARLTVVRDRARADRAAALKTRLQLVRSETVHDIGDSMREFGTAAKELVDNAGRAELRHVAEDVLGRLARDVAALDSRLSGRVRSIDADLELSTDFPPDAPLVVDRQAPPRRSRGLEDKMVVVVGASASVGLGRIAVSPLSMVPALEIAVIPVSLAIGVLCAWWLVRSRALVADRAHLRAWVADCAASAKSELEQSVLARLLAAETALVSAAHENGSATARGAEKDLERVETQLRTVGEHRSSVLAACDRDLMVLARGLERFGFSSATEPGGAPARLNHREGVESRGDTGDGHR